MIGPGIAVGNAAQKRGKCSVFKILTSNSLALKILQTHFANPAPVAAFRGVGGRGVGILTSKLSRFGLHFLGFRCVSSNLPALGAFRIAAASNVYQLINP